MDYFTKWPEARATPDCKAKTISDFLFEEVICRYGVPKILISDRGTSFVNELIREVNQRLHIDHQLTIPYHPQTNGQVKRFNRTLGETLAKLSTTHNDWDLFVSSTLFAYRTMQQKTTKFSPFVLMYGRQACLPIELEINPQDDIAINEEELLVEHASQLVNHLSTTLPKAIQNITQKQEQVKEKHDLT